MFQIIYAAPLTPDSQIWALWLDLLQQGREKATSVYVDSVCYRAHINKCHLWTLTPFAS